MLVQEAPTSGPFEPMSIRNPGREWSGQYDGTVYNLKPGETILATRQVAEHLSRYALEAGITLECKHSDAAGKAIVTEKGDRFESEATADAVDVMRAEVKASESAQTAQSPAGKADAASAKKDSPKKDSDENAVDKAARLAAEGKPSTLHGEQVRAHDHGADSKAGANDDARESGTVNQSPSSGAGKIPAV